MFERNRTRIVPAVAVFALVAAACTSTLKSTSGAGSGTASPAGPAAMALPPGAEKMEVEIASPASGFVLKGNTLTLNVQANYELSAAWSGKSLKPGVGHYHVLLDGSLIDMFTTSTARISMQNVSPGEHTVTVVPALNDHAEVAENEQSITFSSEPKNPLPAITDAAAPGQPSVSILEPADGATVSGTFTVRVAFSNFSPSTALMGKPDVVGYGHWHVNLDSMSGPMMGMGTMLGMSGTTSFVVSTAGLKPGETHTLFALLTDNGHAPIDVFDQIQVTIG